MATKLVLVGLATDGPKNTVVKVESLNQLNKLFGGFYKERFNVSQTATSLTLGYNPWNGPANSLNGKANKLYKPTVSGNILTFGSVGGSASAVIDLEYPPYLGQQDLLVAAKHYIEQTNSFPYVMRVGGTYASYEVAGWTFQAMYPGAKYNKLSLTCNGTSIVVSGLEPYLEATTITGDASIIGKRIDRLRELGVLPLYLTVAGSALTSFAVTLSGGTDGSFSDSDFTECLETVDFPGDSTHVLVLSPMTSGKVQTISEYLDYPTRAPKFFVAPVTGFTAPTSSFITQYRTILPWRLNMLGLVLGDMNCSINNRDTTRYAAENVMLAFDSKGGYNLTNLKVDGWSYSPLLEKEELDDLKAAGFNAITRYIQNDLAVYQGTTSTADWSYLFSSKVAEVHAICYSICIGYIGTYVAEGAHPELRERIRLALSAVSYLSVDYVDVQVTNSTMFVEVAGYLPDEILNIRFSIKNKPSI